MQVRYGALAGTAMGRTPRRTHAVLGETTGQGRGMRQAGELEARRGRSLAMCTAMLVCGLLSSCAPSATELGIAADTAGPLSRAQAESLVEEPLADLANSVSERADEYAQLSEDGAATVQRTEAGCEYVSAVYHSTLPVDGEGWRALADAVRPQMEAWAMDTGALNREERATGAALRGTNPHNGASLSVQTWNDHLGVDLDGPTEGLEMAVRVPLAESECD